MSKTNHELLFEDMAVLIKENDRLNAMLSRMPLPEYLCYGHSKQEHGTLCLACANAMLVEALESLWDTLNETLPDNRESVDTLNRIVNVLALAKGGAE